ncbi:PREDICTED: rhomboid-related protein 4 [Poecilia mexicana]|uniref:Peptidase S54 rhomboid domain-containing protein n=1 Tax=Poecilia mexicana TaxID=48701 RepID=A0A3B3XNH3_9TELE|nr:PREDICTED: rhomboid-related protein 4 [Poecilia mexicana]XP_014850497.1 PREDICTED: rhomboid-related protein 4 [Poecilia mexicana]XP_014850575.1 PREDICTED: rhomboid-related protein 4 [Poecilia mexicana]
MNRRSRSSHLGLLMLGAQVLEVGLGSIPPVTLAVLAINVYLYLFPAAPLLRACVSVQQAYWQGDWRRLLLAPFHHADDWHLYFNMVSLLWKGMNLERRLGAAWFLYVLSVFSVLTGAVYLLLEALLTELADDQSYSLSCAVGFSGVLFALKVLNNHYHPGRVIYLMGLPVASRYASWVELVLIHFTAPGTSFVGHLAGILVGLLYTSGPLNRIMRKCADLFTSNEHGSHHNYYRSAGTSGYAGRSGVYYGYFQDPPDYHTASFTGGLTEEQQLEAAIRNSLHDRGQGHSSRGRPHRDFSDDFSAEETRWRRMRRFDS